MAFYDEMAEMVAELLMPDDDDGLGQGSIEIVRHSAGVPNPAAPYDPIAPVVQSWVVDQIGLPDAKYQVGTAEIVTDTAFMITPPDGTEPQVGDIVRIGGVDIGGIVHVKRLGSIDVPVYFEVFANR